MPLFPNAENRRKKEKKVGLICRAFEGSKTGRYVFEYVSQGAIVATPMSCNPSQ